MITSRRADVQIEGTYVHGLNALSSEKRYDYLLPEISRICIFLLKIVGLANFVHFITNSNMKLYFTYFLIFLGFSVIVTHV